MSNPTGKGGFQERPQDINREGAPKRAKQNWQETIKRLTDMTRDEIIEYVGPKTKLAKLLKELPPDLPLKDAIVLISVIQYGRDPNPRMLAALMDREDGKPNQPVSGKDGGGIVFEVIRKDAKLPDRITNPPPEADRLSGKSGETEGDRGGQAGRENNGS